MRWLIRFRGALTGAGWAATLVLVGLEGWRLWAALASIIAWAALERWLDYEAQFPR